MPAGMMPTGMPVPASSAQTSRTVPSPPQTMTRSAPETAARSAMPVPGSSTVVYCQVGSDQPDSAAIAETEQSHKCYARYWLEYLYGRDRKVDDNALIADVASQSQKGATVEDIVVAFVTSDAFLTRTPEEVQP